MKEFKKGDKVRFRKDFPVIDGFARKYADSQLKDGEIYEVKEDNKGKTVSLLKPYKGCESNCYNPDQFELVENKIEKWAIENTHKCIGEWFQENKQSKSSDYDIKGKYVDAYMHYPAYALSDGITYIHSHFGRVQEGYTLVSLEWFKENILKGKEMYTIQECIDQKVAIICTSEKEARQLYILVNGEKLASGWTPYNSSENFEILLADKPNSFGSRFAWATNKGESWFILKGEATKTINFDQLKFEEQMTEFPKKWSIKGGKELVKLFNKANKEQAFNIGGYNGDSNSYYDFDGQRVLGGSYSLPVYPVVTIQQLEDHYFPVKKQTGWKTKKGFEIATRKICGLVGSENTNQIYEFHVNSMAENALKEANVLELFCDPVFEEKKKDVVINIGSKNHKVTINDKIVVESVTIQIGELKELIAKFKGFSRLAGNWTVSTKEYERFLSIGCGDFSIAELELVVQTYDKWNAK